MFATGNLCRGMRRRFSPRPSSSAAVPSPPGASEDASKWQAASRWSKRLPVAVRQLLQEPADAARALEWRSRSS